MSSTGGGSLAAQAARAYAYVILWMAIRHALFGSVDALSEQMQKAIGQDISSREQFMERMNSALASGEIETVTLTYAAQRRVVLEAIAFGSFLRDVEGRVGSGEHGHMLTPTQFMPGQDESGDDDEDGGGGSRRLAKSRR